MCLDELLEYWQDQTVRGEITDPSGRSVLFNKACGDYVRVDVKITNGIISNCLIEARGCTLCQGVAAYLAKSCLGLDARSAVQMECPLDFEVTPMRKKCIQISHDAFREAVNGGTIQSTGE